MKTKRIYDCNEEGHANDGSCLCFKDATPQSPTPTPWSLDRLESGAFWNIGNGKDDIAICQQLVGDDIKQSKRSANAAYIVRAVNAFEDMARALVEVCLDEETNQYVLKMSTMKMVRQALARAEGKV